MYLFVSERSLLLLYELIESELVKVFRRAISQDSGQENKTKDVTVTCRYYRAKEDKEQEHDESISRSAKPREKKLFFLPDKWSSFDLLAGYELIVHEKVMIWTGLAINN